LDSWIDYGERAADAWQVVAMSTFESPPHEDALRDLREPSPFPADGGQLIGKQHPREVPSEILSLYHREKNPLKAIRARCLDCCCGVSSEVRKCTAVNCPSWAFRLGVNPFREKRQLSVEQKQALASRLSSTRV
jgi:hypothetical protein